MNSLIVEMVSKYMTLTDQEALALASCIPVKEYPKGTILLRAGQVARDSYFNIKGLVRRYYLSDGEEKTTSFFTEEQAISSLNSYLHKIPSDHFLACVEDCTLAVLNYDKEIELYKRVPKFESLCRVSMEEEFGKQQAALAAFITKSPEERYLHLLQTQPQLIHRVPQYHLATYLGVKPESLSRIRKRVSQKD